MSFVPEAACSRFIELSTPLEILTIREQEALMGDHMMEMGCKHLSFMHRLVSLSKNKIINARVKVKHNL